MAFYQSKQILAGAQIPSGGNAYSPIVTVHEYVTPTGGLASGSLVEMGPIPPGYVPVNVVVDTGVLGTSVTLAAGIFTGEYGTTPAVARTSGTEFFAATAAATAVRLLTTKSLAAIAPGDIDAAPAGWGLTVGGTTTDAGIKIRAVATFAPEALLM